MFPYIGHGIIQTYIPAEHKQCGPVNSWPVCQYNAVWSIAIPCFAKLGQLKVCRKVCPRVVYTTVVNLESKITDTECSILNNVANWSWPKSFTLIRMMIMVVYQVLVRSC